MLLFQPTPTPIPSQILSEGLNAIQQSQKLAETVNNLTALGVLGLAIAGFIVWIVLSRNRGREAQTLINALADQNRDTRKEYADIVDDLRTQLADTRKETAENRQQMAKMHEDYRLENFERDGRIRETISAFSDSNTRFADILDTAQKNEQGRDGVLKSISEMLKNGTEPIKRILEATENLVTLYESHTTSLQHLESDMRDWMQVKDSIDRALETIQRKKSDSQQLPPITPEMLELSDDGKPKPL